MSDPAKQERINVYDENAVKQILDDWVRKVVLSKYPTEDFTIGNYKLFFGGLSCLLGAYAHYGAGPWPGSRNALIFCVVCYLPIPSSPEQLAFVVLQLILRYIAMTMEKDFILSTNPHQGQTFRVRTQFSKDTGLYEIELVDRKTEATGHPKSHKTSKSITEYFDKQGFFYGNIVELHVIEALDKFVEKTKPE